MLPNTLVIGLSYGDEGKGKIANVLMEGMKGCVRYAGGNNAGHTVYVEGKKYILHHLPSAIAKKKPVYLEPGMVIHPISLAEEATGFNPALINISEKVHIITDKHRKLDSKGSGIGTTRKGVGPCYADKAYRSGFRMGDIKEQFPFFNFYDYKTFDSGYLFEGAQGVMLDVDYGHYPYVTSSSVFPSTRYKIDKVVGVTKAYVTRVGNGPPNSEEVPGLREAGHEYGSTTGRPRRCHWLDLDELSYSCRLARCDEIAVTKLDVLKKFGTYKYILNGKIREAKSIYEFVDILRAVYPIKYLSWSPGDEIEILKS